MTKLTLKTVESVHSYDILVGTNFLTSALESVFSNLHTNKALIISDENVYPHYGDAIKTTLESFGITVFATVLAPGEQSKRLFSIEKIYGVLAENLFTRGDVIIALGGGVIGDMAGFAASSWMRGIRYIQIPTSLLAQVDSSVGGKTGVDLSAGKNLVGAFWHPTAVITDTAVLATLPEKYYSDGMAEVIKSACIRDGNLFSLLESSGIDEKDMVARCIDIKRQVVQNDERESGERKLLNFGHTLAHALEKHYNYEMSHGFAVAVGMSYITKASEAHGFSAKGTHERLCALLAKYGLPTADCASFDDFVPHIIMDKKRSADKIDIVLLRDIGNAFVHEINVNDFKRFVSLEDLS